MAEDSREILRKLEGQHREIATTVRAGLDEILRQEKIKRLREAIKALGETPCA